MNPFFVKKLYKMNQIIGQEKSVNSINSFFKDFRKGKGLFLYGPVGTGKTSSIYAFAKENNYELLELNASDSRNQKDISDFLSRATGQMSLFATKKIILIDEIDGLSGMKDRGASKVIVEFIKKSTFPIVVVGVNAFDSKVNAITKVCKNVEYNILTNKDVENILNDVLVEENLKIDEKIIKSISRKCNGDARAALNDLFCTVISGEKDVEELESRIVKNSMVDALTRVLKSKDANIFLGAYDNVEEDLDKIFLWLDENIPEEYLEIEDLAKGYENLALADRFYNRIKRWQYYRFYVYCFQILSAGVALAKKAKYKLPPKYKESKRILKYWQANMTFAKRKSIIEKISEKTNTSVKKTIKEIYPFLITALINNKKLADEFDLNDEEVDWLKKNYRVI